MVKNIVFIIIALLLTACSQKIPTIDGQKNRFVNKFFPAKIDSIYSKGNITDKKYPIIFLFDGYEGVWDKNSHIEKLQKMGYHVVSIGYFDGAGYSNNLSRVNIDDIKQIMDRYKRYRAVDSNSIGVLGRGKGAELALLLASYYPEIKMVVGISAPHVAFQAGRATLATESSWVYRGEEVPFVPYPKLSFSALKSFYRVIVHNDNYRDLHDLAIEDRDAVEKARIKVENINGDIFLASAKDDELWNSVLMSKEIIKRLKEKRFTHNYKHKSYRGKWFLRGEDYFKAWGDIYQFIGSNLESKYAIDMFNYLDRDRDKLLSFDEYLIYEKEQEKRDLKRRTIEMLYKCDKNHNQKIDIFEARIEVLSNFDGCVAHNSIRDNTPVFENSCMIGQHSFKAYDSNFDGAITVDEILELEKKRDTSHTYYQPSASLVQEYREDSAKSRFGQCDEDNSSQIDKKEANSKNCHIDESIFKLADTNRDASISLQELTAIPSKYARFRSTYYNTNSTTIYTDNGGTIYSEGSVEETTIADLLLSAIDECDSTHDFKLDKAESTTKECGFTEQEFVDNDKNGDGFFTIEDRELVYKFKYFKKFDKDSDDKLNFSEWISFK